MNRTGIITPLALAALLASGTVAALPREQGLSPQAEEPDTPETREARRLKHASEMDVWLRRLVGRFRIEGVSFVDAQQDQDPTAKPAKGMEDCIALGTGAGVQCVINVVWDEDWGTDGQLAEAGISSLAPAMIEYGYDPVASRIRTLQVDNQSLAEGAAGVLKGDTVSYRTRCVNTAAMPPCERLTRIYAPADASYVQISIDVEKNHDRTSSLMLYLRRMTPEQAGDGSPDVKLPQLPKDQKDQNQTKPRQPQRNGPPVMRPGGSRSRR